MKVSMSKLDVILAEQCKTTANLSPGISTKTIKKIRRGDDIRSDSVGRIAKTLGVSVADILEGA